MKKVFILITVLITVLTVGCARTENDILEYHEQTPSVTDSENKNPGIDESTEDPTKTDGYKRQRSLQKLMGYKRQISLKRLKSLQTKLLIRITSS
jgi:uncharacterized protein YxeA